ncbi:hypothetical protein WA026_011833 [Henosepilachna vigintioctopunctata]|uniref:Uncharacterized protein n=1 Tax=Henosepilachna vigintioctopunctata TaxID=420089 RepID=A0AAW1UJA3_9CUCU
MINIDNIHLKLIQVFWFLFWISGGTNKGDLLYIIYKCDGCAVTQCKECWGFTASEEKCFPLSKRKAIIFCSKCREETGSIIDLMQKNRKLKQEIEKLKEISTNYQKKDETLKNIEKSNLEKKNYIDKLENQICELQNKLSSENNRCNLGNGAQITQEKEELKAQVDSLHRSLEKSREKSNQLSTKLEVSNEKLKEEYNKTLSNNELCSQNNKTLKDKIEPNTDEKIIQYLELFEKKIDSKIQKLENNLYKKFNNLNNEHLQPKTCSYSNIVKAPRLSSNTQMTESREFQDEKFLMTS